MGLSSIRNTVVPGSPDPFIADNLTKLFSLPFKTLSVVESQSHKTENSFHLVLTTSEGKILISGQVLDSMVKSSKPNPRRRCLMNCAIRKGSSLVPFGSSFGYLDKDSTSFEKHGEVFSLVSLNNTTKVSSGTRRDTALPKISKKISDCSPELIAQEEAILASPLPSQVISIAWKDPYVYPIRATPSHVVFDVVTTAKDTIQGLHSFRNTLDSRNSFSPDVIAGLANYSIPPSSNELDVNFVARFPVPIPLFKAQAIVDARLASLHWHGIDSPPQANDLLIQVGFISDRLETMRYQTVPEALFEDSSWYSVFSSTPWETYVATRSSEPPYSQTLDSKPSGFEFLPLPDVSDARGSLLSLLVRSLPSVEKWNNWSTQAQTALNDGAVVYSRIQSVGTMPRAEVFAASGTSASTEVLSISIPNLFQLIMPYIPDVPGLFQILSGSG